MKLYCSLTSPYARKVRVLIRERNLQDRVEQVVVDPWVSPPALLDQNPLGKVPTLSTDDGTVLPDSGLILDYIDRLASGAPAAHPDWKAARRAQLAQGLMDAAVAIVVETKKRPAEYVWQGWLDRQTAVINRTLDALEGETGALATNTPGTVEITLGCALAYIDVRMTQFSWRDSRPGLALWQERFAQRPSMLDTRPPIG